MEYQFILYFEGLKDKKPALVVGGTAQDFLGEYMAGGVLILLGLGLADGEYHRAKYIGPGMHGGVIYLRGSVEEFQLGKEVGVAELEEADYEIIRKYVDEYITHFGGDAAKIMERKFTKLIPLWLRPYGRLYAY